MPKVSGYLEKKGRKKMMSCYKRYWFVLEGRLLLYYKSKDEYDAISPCKGSINLGPTSNVKPCSSNIGVFQIESKTTTITLRAETRDEQHKWMQAIMSALNQNNPCKKLSHFRYSLGELTPPSKKPLERQNTFPDRLPNTSPQPNMKIIEKLQKMGAHTYGIGPKLQRSNTTLERQKQISFSDESLSSTGNLKKDRVFRKTESVIIENQHYGMIKRCTNSVESVDASSEGLYERIPSTDSVFIRKSDVVDNPAYCSITRNHSSDTTDDGIYTEPKEVMKIINNSSKAESRGSVNINGQTTAGYDCGNIDYNDNNLLRQVSKTPQEIETGYCEVNVETNRSSGNSEYADIAQYAEISPRNSSISSQGSTEEKEKKIFKGFGKKNKNQKEKPDVKKLKLKKSESFLQRVWLKKNKNKKSKKEISLSDENILEKLDVPEDETSTMLHALHDILECKATTKKLYGSEDESHGVTDQETSMIYHEVLNDDSLVAEQNQSIEDPPRPLLPPRNQTQHCFSPHHDVPKSHPVLPPKKKKNIESAHLDDILEDLNKQTRTCEKNSDEENEDTPNEGGKVKALIKRFSIGKDEGVEMRRKSNWKVNTDIYCTDSRELDSLLEELAKVTTAPILTPGVTTSLINPEVSDHEFLKMIPIRRRRISDPDYDIPRPHRSLINISKKDDNALEATRFFGPILKPSDLETRNRPSTPAEDYHSNYPSITPDSLEVECNRSDLSHDENRNISYHSHDYLGYNKTGHNHLDFLVENNLYADPRLLYKSRNDYAGIYPRGTNYPRLEDPEHVYVDSLET